MSPGAVVTLRSVARLDAASTLAAWEANRAARERAWRAVRADIIAALGMAPEDRGGDLYAATTGEMCAWMREDGRGAELAALLDRHGLGGES